MDKSKKNVFLRRRVGAWKSLARLWDSSEFDCHKFLSVSWWTIYFCSASSSAGKKSRFSTTVEKLPWLMRDNTETGRCLKSISKLFQFITLFVLISIRLSGLSSTTLTGGFAFDSTSQYAPTRLSQKFWIKVQLRLLSFSTEAASAVSDWYVVVILTSWTY